MSNNVTIGIQTSFQDAGIQAAKRELARLVSAQQQAAKSTTSSGIAATSAERGMLQYASALARSQAAAGNAADGMQTLTAALENVNRASVSALRAQTQLTTLQARVEQGTSAFGRMSSAVQGLNSTLGSFGIAIGVQQVTQFAVSAVQAANTLERTQATVRALSGSQERYNQVLDLARQGQQKYGGSLSDTLEGLGSLVNLSNRTEVSLSQLDAVSRRLAVVDPVQGIKGATIALKEFLTGSDATAIVSLARRFELPKTALKELTDETLSTQQKLDALDRLLADQGITMDVLQNRTLTTAAVYDKLGASFDNAKVAVGGLIATELAPWLKEVGEGLQVVADGLNQFATKGEQAQEASNKAFSGAKTFEDYGQRIDFVNQKLSQIGEHVEPLTRQQFAYAQALVKSGTATDAAVQQATKYGTVINGIAAIQGSLWSSTDMTSNALASLGERLMAASQVSAAYRGTIEALIAGHLAGTISIEQLQTALGQLEASHIAVSNAAAYQAQRHGEQTVEIQNSAAASMTDAENKAEQAAKTQLLEAQTRAATDAFLSLNPNIDAAGVAALVAAGKISPLIGQLAEATLRAREARAALADFQIQQGIKANPITHATQQREIRDSQEDKFQFRRDRLDKSKERRQKDIAAEKEYAFHVANTDQQIAILNQDLSKLRVGSAEYYQTLSRLHDLEQKRDRAGRGKKGGAAKLSDQQKLNNQLLSEQDKAQNRLEEAAENHYQKLLDIEKDYAEKSLAQQRQNEVSKRQSRADFYDNLTSSTKDIGGAEAQRISAEYEAAYQKSQEIAQAGNAKLAADYLALKEQQLEAETQYQQARAQAIKESQEADDKEARKAAAAEAERLDRVRELQRQAEAEEEKQLLEGGDANAQARAKAIEEENIRYQQQQADIIQSSDQATAAKIANAERAGKAIDRENLALERQAQLYNQIGTAQGIPPAATPVVPPGAAAVAPTTAPGSVPVLDVGSLIAAIEAQTGALSGKLDGVIGAVGAVERAISSAQHVPIGG